MNSIEIRNSVRENYNKIADQYCDEFGLCGDDRAIVERFVDMMSPNSKVIDLGGGPGQATQFCIEKNYDAVCYDFSKEMMRRAVMSFPKIPYILDDIMNIDRHFQQDSIGGVIALYSLFHLPEDNLNVVLSKIIRVLKQGAPFLASFKLGEGEAFVDEPFLKENGKSVLYVRYYRKEAILRILEDKGFEIQYYVEIKECGEFVLGEGENCCIHILSRKK